MSRPSLGMLLFLAACGNPPPTAESPPAPAPTVAQSAPPAAPAPTVAQPSPPAAAKSVPPPSTPKGEAAAPKVAPPAPPSAPSKTPAPAAAPKVATAPAAPPKAAAPPAPAKPPLDLRSLEQRLKDTGAIGVLTKLSLKNQVDDLLARFKTFHAGQRPPTLTELRPAFDLLLMKVLSLLQDADKPLANDINASREALWGVLTDRDKLATFL